MGGGLSILGPQGRKRREYGAGAFKEQEVEWILDVLNLWGFGAGGHVGWVLGRESDSACLDWKPVTYVYVCLGVTRA